ncbi:MAG: Gfo/Idh/MocA family oxidoreductase, partial [Streptomyces sp.]|nr:Gfo/Idh/MocA family oxidoreductase [Streptomyces sp.]
MVGHAFMGAAHSHAWRTAGRFFDLPRPVELTAVCGRSAERVSRAAEQYGWQSYETDWRELVARPDIDVVDICTPGDSHAAIALAALAAGKHVLCEKPLANSVREAEEMAAAAAKAAADGVRSMVAFNYRRVPALALARQLVEQGRLGTIRQVRAQYLQDWLVDPDFPLAWRLRKDRAGSGALGDLGAHSIDVAQYLTGRRISSVGAVLETFVTERPLPASSSGLSGTAGSERGQV